ncbi:MAG TPA: FKBP-type peptidyl-prolyl cis-trans isomerase [Planctomycetota bacterium]|nr:FKBP-type peptidyl-prolyl cis-trans isomerase [Planctomycetota bacterium]
MRTSILPLLCLLAACGPSEVEVAEAQRAKSRTDAATTSAGEAPVDLGDGLVLTVLARGGGDFVRTGGRVRVHYTADVVAVGEPKVDPEADAEADSDTDTDDEVEVDTEPATESDATESGTDEGEATESQTETEADSEASEPDTDAPEADAVPAQTSESDVAEEAVSQSAESDAPVADAAADVTALPRRFDSSHARGVPDVWDLSRTASPRLIEGLRRGLVGLTAGSRVTLRVPAALAWGDEGLPFAKVPPRADVLYEIELLEVLP